MQALLGLALASAISFLAYRLHSLSRGGAIASTILGTIIVGLGGWQWALLLIAFFLASSALTKSFASRKRQLNEKYAKSGPRDAGQVAGNGAPAAIFVVLHVLLPQAVWPWLAFNAALAAATADTWATELGALASMKPRLITHLTREVEPGDSGGVSSIGTLAAVSGSTGIGLLAAFLRPESRAPAFVAIAAGGILGALFDSFLGATIQAMYFCPMDRRETERYPFHSCGTRTIRIRGWPWLNNDWVNFGCGAFGALTACLLSIILSAV
jgi:uncharacterized protein (TIGR00297 family)